MTALAAPAVAAAFAFGLVGHGVLTMQSAVEDQGRLEDQRKSSLKKLERLRSLMKKEQAELSRIMAREGGLLEKLDSLQIRLMESERRIEEFKTELQILEIETRELAEREHRLKAEADRLNRLMTRRIQARYRFGRLGYSRLLFEAGDLSDFSRRRHYLEATFRADRKKLDQQRSLLAEWRRAQSLLNSRRSLVFEFQAVLEEQFALMASEQAALEKMLAEIREERKKHKAVLAELRAGARKLEDVLAGLERINREEGEGALAGESVGGFGSLRGRLCWPAAGPVLVKFGKRVHPRFNTEIMHNGVEIGAEPGAPVKAVEKGVVRFASWFQGYGNLVIVDHGGGYYTIYAHLAEFRAGVGQEVAAGQTIGTVGDTGSLEGPSLYFEIRHHRKPLNPESWCAGCSL